MTNSLTRTYNHTVPDRAAFIPINASPGATERSHWRCWVTFWMTLGVLLHALLILFPRSPDDDSDVYLELGRNLFHRGTYGLIFEGDLSPALFRLPGYPIFTALLGGQSVLICIAQCLIDLAGCLLLALFLRRYCSPKAGLAALALSATCLFTATYAATPLTESLSVFAVATAIYCLGELFAKPAAFDLKGWFPRLLPLSATAALAMLLRPDGALLTLSVLVALFFYGVRRTTLIDSLRTAALFVLLACIPLVPWATRNAVTFHVFQPLAPRHVNDPGERVNFGFYRWLRTWSIDFETTTNVFWKVGSETIDLRTLPPRAFDSNDQRVQTATLIAAYNQKKDVDQPLDDRFAALAETRIKADPLRYFVWVPALRVADMWLRPRTEGLDIAAAWWRWREHRWQSSAAIALALLNLLYIVAAVFGAFRRPPLAILLATYFLLRCLLLATLENPEPRYTLEAYPIVFVLAAIAFASLRQSAAIPAKPESQ